MRVKIEQLPEPGSWSSLNVRGTKSLRPGGKEKRCAQAN
jgi:hypothetical protein